MHVLEITFRIGTADNTGNIAEDYDNFRSEVSSSSSERNEHLANKGLSSSCPCIHGAISVGCIETALSEVGYQ